ncbi:MULTISPECIES: OsmC family protein [unclassified Pedobacter]|jgi:putative redox protein|uniref:OsmC family protein n=1 Tax=Pedobacter TaxID=84567 RepID=UPI000B4B7F82|nr:MULTISPECIES: OsmC family protein [unclassified Pedobacter]MCX2583754.1 OsmC family protein [Pedobacter sp. MR22-3]OWK71033.1 osmotically inducible protein OsmC [Pedobacter sp. AJM]
MNINLIRKSGKFNFEAENESGFTVELDAKTAIGGEGKGFRPMEMLLVGLGGCSGIDMVNVLTKQKEPLDDIKIAINATRKDEEMPPIFDQIDIHFDLYGDLSTTKVERALAMTFDKYCSVSNILGRSAKINFTYKINKV